MGNCKEAIETEIHLPTSSLCPARYTDTRAEQQSQALWSDYQAGVVTSGGEGGGGSSAHSADLNGFFEQ